jgi:diadenosine tetraphosphate (Ap4A) HIT family hydrolase
MFAQMNRNLRVTTMCDSHFDRFCIERGICWDVYVSDRGGNNIGRIYFWLNREGIVDFDDLTDQELLELRALHSKYKNSLRSLFQFDGPLNFAYLANESSHGHHCHYHLVPRYKSSRLFAGHEFVDIAWGHQWISKLMPESLTLAIGDAIRQTASKQNV